MAGVMRIFDGRVWGGVALALLLALLALTAPASAQVPPPPYVYLVGQDHTRDLASSGRNYVGDGIPDTWLRFYPRNLDYYVRRGSGPVHIRSLLLRTKGVPFRQWDTVANSRWPLLQVIEHSQRINRGDGSIDGFFPDVHGQIDMYIGDDGLVAGRHLPIELVVTTDSGELILDVALSNFYDLQRGSK